MKVQLAHILQNLFQASSLDEVPVDRLQQMVKEHPYFSTAHFLLSKKLMQHNGGQLEQLQKAAIYFHDPLWLQWQLNHQDVPVAEPKEAHPLLVEEPIVEPEEMQPAPVEEPIAEPEKEVQLLETIEETSESQAAAREAEEETVMAEPKEALLPAAEAEATTPEPEEEPLPEESEKSFHNHHPITLTLTPEPPVAAGDKAAFFDPYYTIDYFASQGIKVPAEVQPGDKLGKQLKSFTEWLKTMKRLPQPAIELQSDDHEQQNIQQIAAGSLEQKEVVTEAMAEVLVKQDKKQEAIAIYEKLSLLDPSKSAYFAAKIENLKAN